MQPRKEHSKTKQITEKYKIKNMIKAIRTYTEETQLPILKEVCFQNEWNYNYVLQLQRDNPELCAEIRRLLDKKEIQLEKALMSGANNTAFIFQLKQLGWKDNPEPLVVNNIVQNNKGGNRSDALKHLSTEKLEALEKIYDEIEQEEKKEQK